MQKEDALQLLKLSGLTLDADDELPGLWLNLNDVFGWGCADGEEITDEDLDEVTRLFIQYGWCGLLYWASKKRGGCRSEFKDINRFIEFVAREEAIITEQPDSSKRAYLAKSYTLGQ